MVAIYMNQIKEEAMDWSELLTVMQVEQIIVTVINPIRKGDCYKTGELQGFKCGIFGGGHSRFKNGAPHSYDSSKRKWIRKPKVLVAYNIFTYGKSQHSDWIDVDNCTFEIKKGEDDGRNR